jgi:pimeloyl-ACP methyl ester carboxylesterase
MPHIHVTEYGSDGRAVVLLHGFPGNANDWQAVAERLSTDHCVLVPDLLGFGQSDKPQDFAALWVDAQAHAILAELDSRGVTTFTLVGHDYGGPVALTIAASQPRRVTRLVIGSCNAFKDPPLQPPMRMLGVPLVGNVVEAMMFAPTSIELMGKTGTRSAKPAKNPRDEVRAVRTIFATALRDLPGTFGQVEQRLPAIQMPTLVIAGDHDPFFPTAHAQRLAHALPNATLHMYENVGHFPHIKRPERYAGNVRDAEMT